LLFEKKLVKFAPVRASVGTVDTDGDARTGGGGLEDEEAREADEETSEEEEETDEDTAGTEPDKSCTTCSAEVLSSSSAIANILSKRVCTCFHRPAWLARCLAPVV
jgi:hypothetical protein